MNILIFYFCANACTFYPPFSISSLLPEQLDLSVEGVNQKLFAQTYEKKETYIRINHPLRSIWICDIFCECVLVSGIFFRTFHFCFWCVVSYSMVCKFVIKKYTHKKKTNSRHLNLSLSGQGNKMCVCVYAVRKISGHKCVGLYCFYCRFIGISSPIHSYSIVYSRQYNMHRK